ncbi:MAG: sulfotransferase [Myxococcota bacterium]|nr:sulfotransferase [Myxococcota bacterium]
MAQNKAIRPMADRYPRPNWVRRVNAMATAVGGARRLIPLDADEIFAQGVEAVGGEPKGDLGDPGWRSRFDQLVHALDLSSMHVVGRLLTREEILRSLRTRLLLHRAWDEDPGMGDERIREPVIVTGPARSGTTILFELLALDPKLRAPLAWEALHPVSIGDSPDLRPLAGECEQDLWADVQPEFAAIHELRSDLPVECVTLTTACFCGPHWPMVAQMETYPDDPAQMYAFHRRILQTLQRGREPKTWLLKTPGHLLTLDLLFETYPDAWIVQTHRDPAKTFPSTISTTAMVQWIRTNEIDLPLLASAIQGAFGFALNNVAERRQEGSVPDRFVDVHFRQLMADPVEAIRRAYAGMERSLDPEHADRILAYLADKPKGKFGVHRYSAEDWGLTVEGLRTHLARYIDFFGVELES